MQPVHERHRVVATSHALIQPRDSGPHGDAVGVHGNDGVTLSGQRDSSNMAPQFRRVFPQSLHCQARIAPVVFGLVFSISGGRRQVGLEFNLVFSHQVSLIIEQQTSNALRATINRQNETVSHRNPPLQPGPADSEPLCELCVPRQDLGHRRDEVLFAREHSIEDGMSIFHAHVKCLFKRLDRPGDDQI